MAERIADIARRWTVKSVEQAHVEGFGHLVFAYCLVMRTFVGGHRREVESVLWVFLPQRVWEPGDVVHLSGTLQRAS